MENSGGSHRPPYSTVDPISYREFCRSAVVGLLLLLAVLLGLRRWVGTRDRVNFLPPSSVDLRRHVISSSPEALGKRLVLLLGHSGVAGENPGSAQSISDFLNRKLPAGTTSYNLGIWGGNLLSSVAVYTLAAPFRARSVVLGLTLEDFAYFQDLLPIVERNLPALQSYLPTALWAKLHEPRVTLLRRLAAANFALNPRVEAVRGLDIQFWLRQARDVWFGSSFSPAAESVSYRDWSRKVDFGTGEALLKSFASALDAQGVGLSIYLMPIIHPERTYRAEDCQSFDRLVKQLAITRSIRVMDFRHALPETPEYFLDSVHLKPIASQRVAELMLPYLGG